MFSQQSIIKIIYLLGAERLIRCLYAGTPVQRLNRSLWFSWNSV